MRRRTVLPLLLLVLVGCQDAKIPLFNPLAKPINRIYSGKEVLAELNNAVADYVAKGWLTQAQVNASIGPQLDKAKELLNAAETLYDAGKPAGDKIEAVNALLRSVRQRLVDIEKARKQ